VTDWSALGGNPFPGDPGSVRSTAGVFDTVGAKVGQQLRLLNSVSNGGTSSWQGPAAAGFDSTVTSLVPALQKLIACHRGASDALKTYAAQLQHFHTSAEQLLARAQHAQQQATAAMGKIGPLNAQANAAQSAYNKAATAPPPLRPTPNFVGPIADPGLESAWQNMVTAQANLSNEVTAWKTAERELTSLQAQANTLNGQAAAAAQACADKVNAAAKPVASSGPVNVVSTFLSSPGFTLATGLLAIPDATVKQLERREDLAVSALQKAETAEQSTLADISQAARDMRSGDTAAARSAAAKIVRDAKTTKTELADTVKAAEDTKGAAEAVVEDFNTTWTSGLPTNLVYAASKGLGYTWVQAYKAVGQKLNGGDPAAEAAAADGADGFGAALGDSVPVVGTVIAGGVSAYDLSQGHYVEAAGNAGGFVASVATGTAIVLLASNPAGWVVIGVSVGVGVAVTEGIDHYKAVVHAGESVLDLPGKWVNGLAHDLNPASFISGL
jgi:uncharacterized protein YukE